MRNQSHHREKEKREESPTGNLNSSNKLRNIELLNLNRESLRSFHTDIPRATCGASVREDVASVQSCSRIRRGCCLVAEHPVAVTDTRTTTDLWRTATGVIGDLRAWGLDYRSIDRLLFDEKSSASERERVSTRRRAART